MKLLGKDWIWHPDYFARLPGIGRVSARPVYELFGTARNILGPGFRWEIGNGFMLALRLFIQYSKRYL